MTFCLNLLYRFWSLLMPSVTVDTILYSRDSDGRYKILLIKRKKNPHKGEWAFPGGFLDINKDKDLKSCGLRELKEETDITLVDESKYNQFATFGDKDRDPRGRVVTIIYTSLVDEVVPQAGDDAEQAGWFLLGTVPELAFDHNEIITQFCNSLINQTYINLPKEDE